MLRSECWSGGWADCLGATIGQALFGLTEDAAKWSALQIAGLLFRTGGWTITGLLIGTSIGAFEMIASLLRGESTYWARRKIMKGLLGGALGGFLGGLFMILQREIWGSIFKGKYLESLWSPRAVSFVILAPASACSLPWLRSFCVRPGFG